jgi:hypothetical protein
MVHVGAMKIYVTTLEAFRRKERRVKTGMKSDDHKN